MAKAKKASKPSVKKEVIVIGSAFGDFHGLGKKIVAGCLRAEMYEVYDLGLNVSAQKFVDEAKAKNAKIIGVSSMMVHSAKGENGPRAIRQILDDEKSNIKLIVGGAPYRYDFELYKEVGAHGFAATAPEVSKLIESLLGGK